MNQKVICDLRTISNVASFALSEAEHGSVMKTPTPPPPLGLEEGRSRAFDFFPARRLDHSRNARFRVIVPSLESWNESEKEISEKWQTGHVHRWRETLIRSQR